MKEKDKYSPGHEHASHLDENELALFAEFLRHEREDLPAGLREHVETCARCRAEVMAVTDMLEEVGKHYVEQMDSGYQTLDFRKRGFNPTSRIQNPKSRIVTRHGSGMGRFTPVIRVVASLAAVIFLAWIIQLIRPEKPEAENIAGADSSGSEMLVVKPADTLLLAQAFVPDSVLEILVSATYRAAHDPKPQGPSNETVFYSGDTLRMQWIPEAGEEYVLVILNNRGVQQAKVEAGQSRSLQWRINLEPGLYYWKFLGKEELWKVGKFKVLTVTH